MTQKLLLTKNFIDTPLGQMIVIADKYKLYFLDFADKKDIDQKIERLSHKINAKITIGLLAPIISIKNKLKPLSNFALYFS